MDINVTFELMNRDFFQQEILKSPVDLNQLYSIYQYYILNLGRLIKIKEFDFNFYRVDELIIPDNVIKDRFAVREDFLATSSALRFGREIDRNGTYWPMIISDGILREGIHRAVCLQAVNSAKSWLCWEFSDRLFSKQLNTPIELFVLFPSQYEELVPCLRPVEQNIYSISITKYQHIYEFMVLFSKYFSKLVIQFRNDFKASDIINSESVFKEWRKNQ